MHARLAVALAMLAACGRIGIEPLVDAAPVDVAPVTCAIEGADCDDRNICSPASTCQSGVCTGTGGPCTVADFELDYSLQQGTNGWFYGYWNLDADPGAFGYQPEDFLEMAVFPGDLWRPPDWQETGSTFSWCYVIRWGGHPGSFPIRKLPIRRWVSDVAGYADVIVRLAKSDTSNGDGVRALLFVDGAQLLDRGIAFDDDVGFEVAIPVELAVSTRVDLLLDYIGNDTGDTSEVGLRITSR